jgi:hypothetical protein
LLVGHISLATFWLVGYILEVGKLTAKKGLTKFQPGNELQLKHGALQAKRTDPIAQMFLDELAADPSLAYLTAPRFRVSAWAWAVAEAKVMVLTEWVDEMTIRGASRAGPGQTSPMELLRKWMVTAANMRVKMGLDPASAAKLGKDVAGTRQADAATLLTQLRTEHEAAEAAERQIGA